MPKERYQEILDIVTKIPNIPQDEEAFKTMKYPSAKIEPIPELGAVSTNGIRCNICKKYLVITLPGIKLHLTKVHQWVNPAKRGRPGLAGSSGGEDTTPWTYGHHFQKLRKSGPFSANIEVKKLEE
jgi:hypothetical protein